MIEYHLSTRTHRERLQREKLRQQRREHGILKKGATEVWFNCQTFFCPWSSSHRAAVNFQEATKLSVAWTEETVDNEHLQKKSSKSTKLEAIYPHMCLAFQRA